MREQRAVAADEVVLERAGDVNRHDREKRDGEADVDLEDPSGGLHGRRVRKSAG